MQLVLHPKVYSDIDEIMGYYDASPLAPVPVFAC
jgi:hypothetical protein